MEDKSRGPSYPRSSSPEVIVSKNVLVAFLTAQVQFVMEQLPSSQKPSPEAIAEAVIDQLQKINDIREDEIIIIGELAVRKYLKLDRRTEDIDIYVAPKGGLDSLKMKLLALTNTPFREESFRLKYVCPFTQLEMFINFRSQQDFPFTPKGLKPISQVTADNLPYISLEDLLPSKIFSCGLRTEPLKRSRDAVDFRSLLDIVEKPVRLTAQQWIIMADHLPDVVAQFDVSWIWWEKKLGLENICTKKT